LLLQNGSDFAAADLRFKVFAQKRGTLFIFAIDASGSMALNRINQAKGALLRLLKQSYINRDSVAIIGFRGTKADVLLPPSRSIGRARRLLDTLTVGGGTPLSAGLACSVELARRAQAQELGEIALLLFTDGHANVPLREDNNKDRAARDKQIAAEIVRLAAELRALAIQTFIVGTHNPFLGSSEARSLAATLGAQYLQVSSVAG
jgi:magnesium chelatase subunit D